MAFNNTPGSAEYVVSGAAGLRSVYTEKRKYDKSDLFVFQSRRLAKFDWLLRDKGDWITVTDPEPRTFTEQEAPIKFNVKTDSGTTTYQYDTLYISDTEAKWLQQHDTLICQDLFCDTDGANYSTTKFSSGYMPENLIVNSVTLSGAASGVASVLVTRGNGYNYKVVGDSSSNTVTVIASEYKLLRGPNAQEDGWSTPVPKSSEPTYDYNYIQTISHAWGETELKKNTDVYGKLTMADLAKRQKKQHFREREHAMIWGRKLKNYVSGELRYKMGGMVEYIPTSSTALDSTDHIYDFGGSFEIDTMREKAEQIFKYGSETKWAFVGGSFLTKLWNLFEKFLVMNDNLANRWGWKVYELDLGHGVLLLMEHPLFAEMSTSNNSYNSDMLIIDPEYVQLMKMKNMDVRVKSNTQDNNVHYRIDEITSSTSIRRLHPSAHWYIYGIL